MRVLRQGDVVLREVNLSLKEYDHYRCGDEIVIEGETGHSHVMRGVSVYQMQGQTYVVVEKPSVMTHEEHRPLIVPPGVYEVTRVRDFQGMRRIGMSID